jgi:uncharacterized protein YkwD
MKICIVLAVAVVLAVLPFRVNAGEISVTVEGVRVDFPDATPTLRDDRTLVPVRAVFDLMGYYVAWDDATRTAHITAPGVDLRLTIGSDNFYANGRQHALDVPAQIIDERTMVPLRLPLEALGYSVGWDGASHAVTVAWTSPLAAEYLRFMRSHGVDGMGTEAEPLLVVTAAQLEAVAHHADAVFDSGAQFQLADISYVSWRMQGYRGNERTELSAIALPNRRLTDGERDNWTQDYNAHGGATGNELETIRLINLVRALYGLPPVAVDDTLMMAARFFAQQAADIGGAHAGSGGSHNFGPYATDAAAQHGASANVAAAFGGNLRWNGGNWFGSGEMTAEALVFGWMNSPGHRRFIVSAEHRYAGLGQFPGGVSYLFMSENPSN